MEKRLRFPPVSFFVGIQNLILLSTTPKAVIMPFKYTDEKENFLYAWRAFSYGKKIEIFCCF